MDAMDLVTINLQSRVFLDEGEENEYTSSCHAREEDEDT